MSNKGWFVDSGIIAQGSSHQYFEEIHYFQSMRWRKEQDRWKREEDGGKGAPVLPHHFLEHNFFLPNIGRHKFLHVNNISVT